MNQLAQDLGLPSRTVATNVAVLDERGPRPEGDREGAQGEPEDLQHGLRGVPFTGARTEDDSDLIEVEVPIGLFTSFEGSAPCGLCSTESIIGHLDMPARSSIPAA